MGRRSSSSESDDSGRNRRRRKSRRSDSDSEGDRRIRRRRRSRSQSKSKSQSRSRSRGRERNRGNESDSDDRKKRKDERDREGRPLYAPYDSRRDEPPPRSNSDRGQGLNRDHPPREKGGGGGGGRRGGNAYDDEYANQRMELREVAHATSEGNVWGRSLTPPPKRDIPKQSKKRQPEREVEQKAKEEDDVAVANNKTDLMKEEPSPKDEAESSPPPVKRGKLSKSKRPKKTKSSKKKKKKGKKNKKRSRDSSDSESGSENSEGEEKHVETVATTEKMTESEKLLEGLDEDELREARQFKADVQGNREFSLLDDSDDEIGPKPLIEQVDKVKEMSQAKDYGGALMPGEGAAIAQFVQKNMRIPRRGEVGWTGTEIEGLEVAGFVMSGSRHTRMNAIRIRKENQVYSAEEKRALTLINFEEKQQRENKLLGDFRTMLTQRMKDVEKEKELVLKANAN